MNAVLGVLLWLALSALVGALARHRGRSGIGYFLVSALLTPLIGLLVVLAIRNLREDDHLAQIESIMRLFASNQPRQADSDAAASDGPSDAVTVQPRVIKFYGSTFRHGAKDFEHLADAVRYAERQQGRRDA